MPLRFAALPGHDARTETMTIISRSATAGSGHWHWGAQELWAQLEPLLPGLSVEVLARAPSTNALLLERARIAPNARNSGFGPLRDAPGSADAPERVGRRQADLQPCLLVAEHQTAGHGRQGRGWRSARGASLTFSLALPLAPQDWSGLSLAVGVALADALQPEAAPTAPRLMLKWPNDLWLLPPAQDAAPERPPDAAHGRKLGGILIETLVAGRQRLAVIGIGLNVTPLPAPLPTDLVGRLAALNEFIPDATAPAMLARVALPLVQALQVFEREGFAAFGAAFAARDMLRDEAVRTTAADTPEGIARGVDAQGALRLDVAGRMHTIASGEVSVRPAAGPDTIASPDTL
ncbi:MAG: biotin--[acetyl-CoA-carboxylase] ligase [Burkholderiaceae bacterium]|nr:biotin--[acetyl-CoA-carboxylase] ligase [Burkholderiaceae bacterium]